jgi:hypothetical protein
MAEHGEARGASMKTIHKAGLSALGFAALFGAVGCGGAAAPMAPPQPSGEVAFEASTSAPSPAPGYRGGGGMDAPAPPPPSASADGSWTARKSAPRAEAAPEERPGLGTQWGETRTSRISMVSFERGDHTTPFATAALFYNDEEGARAMAGSAGFRRTGGMFTMGNGLVALGLRDESGRFYNGFNAGGRNFAVGESGRRYTIVLRNNTSFRLEVVVSVDGLDVLDGKAASFHKRGYIMDPRAEVEIDGFRQSMDAVASFRFGSVRGSYAGQKTGDTRNVGVIGVALFNEVGTVPVPWTPDEVQRRRDANPFPGQFATPP